MEDRKTTEKFPTGGGGKGGGKGGRLPVVPVLVAGAVGAGLSLALILVPPSGKDAVSTAVSGPDKTEAEVEAEARAKREAIASGLPARCLFVCSRLLRAKSDWPDVYTVKSTCFESEFREPCPASHPKLKRNHVHSTITPEHRPGKFIYLWVQERYCCKP